MVGQGAPCPPSRAVHVAEGDALEDNGTGSNGLYRCGQIARLARRGWLAHAPQAGLGAIDISHHDVA